MNDRSSTGSRHNTGPLSLAARTDLAHALKLQKRTRDACDHIAHEQEQCRFTVDNALVTDGYGHFDAFARLHGARIAPQIEERKETVGQAVTKVKLRRRRHIEI